MLHWDIYRQIALSADIDTLKEMQQSATELSVVCSEEQFWHDKFAKDGLPLITKRYSPWSYCYEYELVKDCIDKTNELISRYNRDTEHNKQPQICINVSSFHDIRLLLPDSIINSSDEEFFLYNKPYASGKDRVCIQLAANMYLLFRHNASGHNIRKCAYRTVTDADIRYICLRSIYYRLPLKFNDELFIPGC